MTLNTVTKLSVPQSNSFEMQIKYSELQRNTHHHEIELHVHDEFELYVNLSGDVSFLVEDRLYRLSRGDVILARPGEHHHCVYRSDKPHRLYWILFDCSQNRALLDFLQSDFPENYISPKDELREELLELIRLLHSGTPTEEEKLYSFFRIFAILKQSRDKSTSRQASMPRELIEIIDYINKHICEELTVSQIAKALYVSQRTVERKCREHLAITPAEFIRRKKLVLAAELLQRGESVLAAGTGVGYSDNSYFIELFKRYYGVTPYHYRKMWQQEKIL